MNRIYQGRVTSVEQANPDHGARKSTPWISLPDWPSALWQHHELFHDAVNYYLVALLALATELDNPLHRIRCALAEEGSDFQIWRTFSRRGKKRRGLGESVAKYLTPGNASPTPDECFAAVVTGSDVSNALRDLALAELLFVCSGDAPIKNQGAWMLARFCAPSYSGSFPFDAAAFARDAGESQLTGQFQALTVPAELSAFAESMEISWVVNLAKGAAPFTGEDSRLRLLKAVAHFEQVFGGKTPGTKIGDRMAAFLRERPTAKQELANIRDEIRRLRADRLPKIPANNRSIPDHLEACLLFKFFPTPFTADLLKVSFPPAKRSATRESPGGDRFVRFGGDAIELARGKRGYVFRAFTSLPGWNVEDSPEPQWRDFDIAAFKYALTALNQIEERGEDRRKQRERMERRSAYMRGLIRKLAKESEDDALPPVLKGDPRIARIEHLVDVDLREEYEMSEGVEVRYGLHPRTIRGFRDLRKKWNAVLDPEETFSEERRAQLLAVLHDYQTENAEVVGSVRLFAALLDEANWIVWRTPSVPQLHAWREAADLPADAGLADDPLQALTDERELLAEIERLKEPIRLTPADPEHSRRQFLFSDITDLAKKNRLRHDRQTVDVQLAVEKDGRIGIQWARLLFSAPRLLRDQLGTTAAGDSSPAWQQAMMAALGLRADLTKEGEPASFADCAAVALMPETPESGERRFLLNFPVTLPDDTIAGQLGIAAKWDDAQFGGADGDFFWLRWPSTAAKKAKTVPWWKRAEPFRCLSVDLGQRDAAAFALLEATPGGRPKPQSRRLGEADGLTWWATVRAMGMLRLPGENAKTLRDGGTNPVEELSGKRGRLLAGDGNEWSEACDMCARLGLAPEKILGDDPARFSFPELNDQLLFALRRTQARLARLQSWSSLAHEKTPAKRRQRIIDEINETEIDELGLKPLIASGSLDAVAARLTGEIFSLRTTLQQELVRIAGRILPLRNGIWEWTRRTNDPANHILRRISREPHRKKPRIAGQRGLSLRRILQLESLRQRCQSLNRALQQTPGGPAKLGRSRRGVELPDPCPEILARLDALKEQRVNQTAHLILAEALGLRLRPHRIDASTRLQRDIHGEYERIPGRTPADFIVIENLKYYETTQARSRRENARLMLWCRRQLRKKLIELCEPFGLHVLEEWPADTSKFCSRTGIAGFRAVELTPEASMEWRWKKHLDRLADPERARKLTKDERLESERVKALFAALDRLNSDLRVQPGKRPQWRTLFAPVPDGNLFVPMRGSPQQADVNAAINIGLRAIAAPDNHEIHLRIRSTRDGNGFVVRAENVREKARWGSAKYPIAMDEIASLAALAAEQHALFFADAGNVADFDRATISDVPYRIASSRGIRGTIRQKEWLRVGTLNNDRLEGAGLGRLLDQEDEIRM
jgi:hypothetical protein